jgi:glycosidase
MSLPGATLEGAMMHIAFTLSVRGTPQLYSGEEIAMEGGDDPENRRDFPGGFPGDSHNAFEASGRTANEQRMFDWTRSWIKLRREREEIRRGRLIDLFYDNESYVFARQLRGRTSLIAFNRENKERKIEISMAAIGVKDGAAIVSMLGSAARAVVKNGKVDLTVSPKSAVAFEVR